ncbi:MAG TPA: NAD-dependent epimerase/dehydratase family protein [Pseudonocardiaceae bacterium]|jgi:nucleoside-diphosphate-sugar epimerase
MLDEDQSSGQVDERRSTVRSTGADISAGVSDITTDLEIYNRIVVTGGLGFVGRHMVSTLASIGKSVLVLDVARPSDTNRPNVSYCQADIRDMRGVTSELRAADLVIHLAGNPSGTLSIDRPRFDFETNAEGTFNLCEALAGSSIRRLVYLSTAMVYGVPRTCPVSETHPVGPFLPYAASKLSGEHVVSAFGHALGLPATIGRAFTVYGAGEDPRRAGGEVSQFLRWHLNDLPIRATGDIDRKTRDFCAVDDLVRGLLFLATRGAEGEVYNLGSGTETSLRELADVVGAATGRPAVLDSDESITDDTYRMVADIGKLRDLGYRPTTSLLDGVGRLAERLGDHPELPAVDTIFQRGQRDTLGAAR